MSKRPTCDDDVVTAPVNADVLRSEVRAPEPRRSKRRFVWPFALAAVLSLASWTIAQAATLPALPVDNSAAGMLVADELQAPVDAPVPSAVPKIFGPQLEVILPPPPPPPPPAPGRGTTTQRKAAAASAASSGMSIATYCAAGYDPTASAASVSGLLAAANAERANFGIGALTWSSSLATDAQNWSSTMAANQSSHTEYDLNTDTGISLVGTQGWYDNVFHHSGLGAENIAFAFGRGTNPAGAHSGWMKSKKGHCDNILNARYTQFGAGDAWSSDSGYFATERFS